MRDTEAIQVVAEATGECAFARRWIVVLEEDELLHSLGSGLFRIPPTFIYIMVYMARIKV
jgi:hypothetical protein